MYFRKDFAYFRNFFAIFVENLVYSRKSFVHYFWKNFLHFKKTFDEIQEIFSAFQKTFDVIQEIFSELFKKDLVYLRKYFVLFLKKDFLHFLEKDIAYCRKDFVYFEKHILHLSATVNV